MITIQLNSQNAILRLNAIARQLQQPRQLYGILGETLKKIHDQRFKEQKAPDGRPWQPVSPRYAAYKAAKGKGSQILKFEGNLANRTAYNFDDRSVEFGSPMLYAKIHQFGGQAGRGRKAVIPARPWLGVSSQDEQLLLGKATRHLDAIISRMG